MGMTQKNGVGRRRKGLNGGLLLWLLGDLIAVNGNPRDSIGSKLNAKLQMK